MKLDRLDDHVPAEHVQVIHAHSDLRVSPHPLGDSRLEVATLGDIRCEQSNRSFQDNVFQSASAPSGQNPNQQAQAKDILAKEKPTLDLLSQQMDQGHQALKQLENSGTFDEAKVRAVASQQAQTMTDLIVEKARIHSALFQILTPDQKTKMTQLMDKHGHGGMRHHQQQQNQQQDQTPNQ